MTSTNGFAVQANAILRRWLAGQALQRNVGGLLNSLGIDLPIHRVLAELHREQQPDRRQVMQKSAVSATDYAGDEAMAHAHGAVSLTSRLSFHGCRVHRKSLPEDLPDRPVDGPRTSAR